MALIAADTTGNNYQKVPAGTHIARCYGVIDLGSQTTNGQYGEKTQRKVKKRLKRRWKKKKKLSTFCMKNDIIYINIFV